MTTRHTKLLEDSNDILTAARECLETKVKLAVLGLYRSKNIALENLNSTVRELLQSSKDGMVFWRDYVTEKSLAINVEKCALYF